MPIFVPDESPFSSPRLEVPLPGPLDLPASLDVFRRSGDDLIDRWDGTHLLRTVPVGDRSVAFAATVAGTPENPVLHVELEDPSSGPQVAAAIATSFVPAPPEFAALLGADPVLARLNRLFPGVRPVLQLDLLTALVRCISAQQVNLRWAVATRRRRRPDPPPPRARSGCAHPHLTVDPDLLRWRLSGTLGTLGQIVAGGMMTTAGDAARWKPRRPTRLFT